MHRRRHQQHRWHFEQFVTLGNARARLLRDRGPRGSSDSVVRSAKSTQHGQVRQEGGERMFQAGLRAPAAAATMGRRASSWTGVFVGQMFSHSAIRCDDARSGDDFDDGSPDSSHGRSFMACRARLPCTTEGTRLLLTRAGHDATFQRADRQRHTGGPRHNSVRGSFSAFGLQECRARAPEARYSGKWATFCALDTTGAPPHPGHARGPPQKMSRNICGNLERSPDTSTWDVVVDACRRRMSRHICGNLHSSAARKSRVTTPALSLTLQKTLSHK
jgi:hypothetical protein